jgi:hypothetical protein
VLASIGDRLLALPAGVALVARCWGAVVSVTTVLVGSLVWSRVYLGANRFTDGLAGAALGGAVVLDAVSVSLWVRAEERAPAEGRRAAAMSTG